MWPGIKSWLLCHLGVTLLSVLVFATRGFSPGYSGLPLFSNTKIRPEGPKNIFWETIPPYLRVWMTDTPPPPLSEGLDQPLVYVM